MGLEGTSSEGEVPNDSDESSDEDLLALSLWAIILMRMELIISDVAFGSLTSIIVPSFLKQMSQDLERKKIRGVLDYGNQITCFNQNSTAFSSE